MNHNALIDYAEARFQDTGNDVVSAATWSEYLNHGYQDANSRTAQWPWLETLSTSVTITADSNTAALPADTYQVHSVYNTTDSNLLVPSSNRSQFLVDYIPGETGEGSPSIYRLRGTTLEVYPAPSIVTALRIEYIGVPAALATTDEPVWPEQWHRGLVYYMLAQAYLDDGNTGMATQYELRWEAHVTRMFHFILSQRTSMNYAVADTFFDGTSGD